LENDEALFTVLRQEVAKLIVRNLNSAKNKKMLERVIEAEVKKELPALVRDIIEEDNDVYDDVRHTVSETVVKMLKSIKF